MHSFLPSSTHALCSKDSRFFPAVLKSSRVLTDPNGVYEDEKYLFSLVAYQLVLQDFSSHTEGESIPLYL